MTTLNVTRRDRQLGGKRVYLYAQNGNQLDPFASKLTRWMIATVCAKELRYMYWYVLEKWM